jgi:hypothetical protein
LKARKTITGIEQISEAKTGGTKEIVIMKGSQVDPILESRNKAKKVGLSAHAIPLVIKLSHLLYLAKSK